MPSTYSSLTYHIVFSTKHRRPFITKEFRDRLYAYIGGIIRSEGGVLLEIGGIEDHIHVLVSLKPNHTISDFMRVLKANSSKWLNEELIKNEKFGWQEGYSVFTVSQSQVEKVKSYIQKQEEHHSISNFQDELESLCKRHNIEFDPT